MSITSTDVQSSYGDGLSWRDRSINRAGGYSGARFLFSASDFPSAARTITFTLSCNENTNTAFTPYLWVGDSSPDDYTDIASTCWQFAALSTTPGDASWSGELTATITDASTIATFLSKIKSQLYIYIHGTNTDRQSVVVDCLSLTIDFGEGHCYVWTTSTTSFSYPTAAMTSNSSQSCVASASTQYSSSYAAWYAFNKNTTKAAWATTASDTAPWLQLKMPQALCDLTFTITNRGDRDNHINGPLTGIFYGSNDGSSWTQIGTFTRTDGTTKGGGTSTHSCSHRTAYQYARVSISTWEDDGSGYCAVGELEISGTDISATGGWKPATAYVYSNGWNAATPYITT